MKCTPPRLVLCCSDKVNIYNNKCFIPLPVTQPPLPPPSDIPLFRPRAMNGSLYPTPTYKPPFTSCTSCQKSTPCSHCNK